MRHPLTWTRAEVPVLVAVGVGIAVTALVLVVAQALHWEIYGLTLISGPASAFLMAPLSERLMGRLPSVFGPPEAQPVPWGFVAIAIIMVGLGCLAVGVDLSRIFVAGAIAGPGAAWIGGAALGAVSVVAYGAAASVLGWLALYGDALRGEPWGHTLQRLWPLIIAVTLGAAGIEGLLRS